MYRWGILYLLLSSGDEMCCVGWRSRSKYVCLPMISTMRFWTGIPRNVMSLYHCSPWNPKLMHVGYPLACPIHWLGCAIPCLAFCIVFLRFHIIIFSIWFLYQKLLNIWLITSLSSLLPSVKASGLFSHHCSNWPRIFPYTTPMKLMV